MPSEPTVDEVRELLTRAELCLHDGVSWAGPSIEIVAALCRHFLASQQPMTAGEFAGAMIAEFARWENAKGGAISPFMAGRRAAFASAAKLARDLAREHNITIVEPKK